LLVGTATASTRIAASEAELEAQTLVEKKREIMAVLGGESLAYNTIKKAGMQKTRAYSLFTGEQSTAVDLGSFVSSLDGRLRTAEVAVNLGQKRTWSYSFNSKTMECGCARHKNVVSFPRRGSGVKGSRQVIWLCDQSMPPILPATDESNCVKIIRLEYGFLGELAEGLTSLLAGRQVAGGSVVLLSSLTNMAATGTAGYISDLLAAIKFLRSNVGDHLVFGVLPNIMLDGCSDPATVCTVIEVGRWAQVYFKNCDSLLSNSLDLAEREIKGRGEGGLQSGFRRRLRLPSSPACVSMTTYEVGGEGEAI
jgi:hypothetical protein